MMNINKLLKIFILISVIFYHAIVYSYVGSKTSSGAQIKWATGATQINLYFNAANDDGVNESLLQSIANSSAAEWNVYQSISINKGVTTGTNQVGVNEIIFSNDPEYFSGGSLVAGSTIVNYSDESGHITEGNIYINSANAIDTNLYSSSYIGNILTHEMGHFLGLDHGQTLGSTMFWALFSGQSRLAEDDKAGLYSVYPTNTGTYGSLTGKIVGGKSLYGILGVSVEAISSSTGKVMGATFSNVDGSFLINGLAGNDKYFIYTKPAFLAKLQNKYTSAKTNFCDNGKSFRGSFYQACGGGNEGYPQAVSLNGSTVDVGNISIRCSLDVPPEYLQKKNSSQTDFNLIPNIDSGVGNAFVGFFSNQEINSGTATDAFNIDLTNIANSDWSNLSSANLFLEIQVLNQNFYTPFKANLSITRNSVTTIPAKFTRESDGWVDINTITRVSIDKTNQANNRFEILITPEKMNNLVTPTGLPAGVSIVDILPDYSDFVDGLYFYLVNTRLVKLNSDGVTYTEVSSRRYVVSDNTSCTDAINSYQLSGYTTGTSGSTSKKVVPISCGTIKTDSDDNPQGPIGMIVGFCLSFLVVVLVKRVRFL